MKRIFNNVSKDGMIAVTVVGGGGTGSYLIEDLINLLNITNMNYKIKVVDGDLLEDKNLLRQGFYKDEVGLCKAEALVERFKNNCNEYGSIENVNDFIRDARFFVDLWDLDKDNITDFYIISCVDNQFARLRMTLGHHLAFHWFKRNGNNVNCYYIDSGNTEFFGQTIKSVLKSDDDSVLSDFGDAYLDKRGTINACKRLIKENVKFKNDDLLASMFQVNSEWTQNLTRADHEMSCDDMAVSAPQNILVNQFSSVGILEQMNYCLESTYNKDNGVSYFDSRELSLFTQEFTDKRNLYSEFFKEMLEFYLTDEGQEVFKII